MAKTTANQVYDRSLVQAFSEMNGTLLDVCKDFHSLELRDAEEKLLARVKRVTGRDAQLIEPYKGTDVRCEIDGVVFAMDEMKDRGQQLGVIIECPTCGRENPLYFTTSIRELCDVLVRSQHDSRCYTCVKSEWMGRRLAKYGHDGHDS